MMKHPRTVTVPSTGLVVLDHDASIRTSRKEK